MSSPTDVTMVTLAPRVMSMEPPVATVDVATMTTKQDDTLEAFYDHIFAGQTDRRRAVDVATIQLAGHTLSVWVDDEGLYYPNTEIEGQPVALGLMFKSGHPHKAVEVFLAGRCVITGGPDEEGNTTDCPIPDEVFKMYLRDGVIEIRAINTP